MGNTPHAPHHYHVIKRHHLLLYEPRHQQSIIVIVNDYYFEHGDDSDRFVTRSIEWLCFKTKVTENNAVGDTRVVRTRTVALTV
jgi:hypothetical protein